MSFNSKDFSVMAYANGFTLWSYSTADTLATVKADAYFNTVSPFARKGDMIMITAGMDSTIESDILSIKSVSADEVVAGSVVSTTVAAA